MSEKQEIEFWAGNLCHADILDKNRTHYLDTYDWDDIEIEVPLSMIFLEILKQKWAAFCKVLRRKGFS